MWSLGTGFFYLIFYFIFFFLAATRGTWDLSSLLTRDQTRVPCIGSTES